MKPSRRLFGLVAMLLAVGSAWFWQKQARAREIPAEARRRYQDGVALLQAGDPTRAVEAFDGALRIEPQYVDALAESGIAYMSINDPVTATRFLRAAVELDPWRSHVYCHLGEAYLRDYDPESARAHLDAALAINPRCGHARFVSGEWYRRKASFSSAIREFKKAAELLPDTEEPLVKLAAIYLMPESRRLEEAARALESAQRIAPDSPLVHLHWGRLWAQRPPRKENLEAAYAALKRASASLGEAHSDLARVCEKLGRPQEAMDNYLRALEFVPNDKILRYNVAQLLIRVGRKREAEEHLAVAREVERRESEIHVWQGRLGSGDDSPVRLHLARLYEQSGLIDSAVSQLRLALRADPMNRQLSENLNRLMRRR